MASPGSRTPVTAFRAFLLVLCGLLSVLASERSYAALPIAFLAALALAAERVGWLRNRPGAVGVVEAAVAGACVVLTGGVDSPMLPYLLAPPTCVGLLLRRLGWVPVVSLASVVALAAARLLQMDGDDVRPLLAAAGQWLLLGFGLGIIANRARVIQDRLVEDRGGQPAEERYVEARELLQQLRAVSRRLPGGLDAAASAEGMLQMCAAAAGVAVARSAVLVQVSPGALVPIAVHGTRRVPWRAPLTEKGPLQQAWESAAPAVDRREPDQHGRRKGSTLVVVPLCGDGKPFGLVVMEAFDSEAFTAEEIADAATCVDRGAIQLETALLFEEVRSSVSVAERDRLAREMHDGVAQDLAFIGYSLDDLRNSALKVDPHLAAKVAELRGTLTGLVTDLRLSITDLKTSVSSERGLGSALTSYVRALGSGGKLAVHLSLDESAFRLPGEQEVLLLQVAQAVGQDARRNGDAANLWVRLSVDPPAATLVLEHDAPSSELSDLSAFEGAFRRMSGTLRVSARSGTGVRVDAVLRGGSDVRDRHAGR